jgi:hypothetical protein
LTDKQPTNPTSGSVWIHVKQSSSTSITTNEVSIPIAYVQQYKNGAWQTVTAAIYDGKDWVTLNYTSTETASEATIVSGKTAIVNGTKLTGTLSIPAASILKGKTVGGVFGTATSDATATSTDITSGKTAYVNGSKITGTKSESIYFNVTSGEGKLYLQNKEVAVFQGSCGSYSNAICVSWSPSASSTQTLAAIGEKTNTTNYTIDGTYQISSDVIAVYYHSSATTKKTNDDGNMYEKTTYQYYLDSYVISSGKLTRKTNMALTFTPNNYNFKDELWDPWFTKSNIYQHRYVDVDLSEQLFSNVLDRTNTYLTFYEHSEEVYDHDTDSKDYEVDEICMRGFSVNRFSGAITKATNYACGKSTYYPSTEKYDSKNSYERSKYGLIITTFDNVQHDNSEVSFSAKNLIGTSVVNISSVSCESYCSSLDLYQVLNDRYGYQSDILYALDGNFYFSRTGSVDTVSATLYSASTNSSVSFSATTTQNIRKEDFDISGIVPTSVSYRSQSVYYSPLTQKFYVTMTFSAGKLYLIFGVSQHTVAIDGRLTPTLESATYRSKEDGRLLSTEQANYLSNKVIKYYK